MVVTSKGHAFVRWLYVWIHASKELKKAKQNGAIMHAMIKMAFLPNLFYWFCCYLFVFLLVWSVERKKFSLMFYNLGIKTMFYCFMRLFICFCQNTFDVEYDVWQSLTNLESVKLDCLFHFCKRTHFDKSVLKYIILLKSVMLILEWSVYAIVNIKLSIEM